jgi:hypothetical protein
MLIGVLLAALATLCGVAVNRPFRAPTSLAPFTGLAAIVVLTSWCSRLGAPPALGTAGMLALAVIGLLVLIRSRGELASLFHRERLMLALLGLAIVTPIGLLGAALASVDAPISTHDGAFHVETVDALRVGLPIEGWYPMGFHTSVAAVLRLVPWLDSARGTAEAAQGLALLAPLGIFALARGLGLSRRVAALGALILSLTYIFPYDDHMWAGWPLATSILLLLGLWSIAARWIREPHAGLALLGGLMAGAILLTHGTEVYSSIVGLAVIAALGWRHIRLDRLVRHLPLALAGAALCALPYLATLLGWAAAGGATSAAEIEQASSQTQGQAAANGGDWLEFALGLTGAGGLIDLPFRVALLWLGARQKWLRVPLVGWLVFGTLLFAVSFLDVGPVHRFYALTFPWLVHHRPPQMVVLFASLLVGGGVFVSVRWLWNLRSRLVDRPAAWRRLAAVSGALLLFLAEGSVVTIFKTLDSVIAQQNVYSLDDRAAMSWLRQNGTPGEMIINDAASDAGIWAPYKAGLAVLLPRTASGALQTERGPILSDLLSLKDSPDVKASACALRADYVFAGSRRVAEDAPALPDRTALEQAPELQQVFASGDTAVYRVNLDC